MPISEEKNPKSNISRLAKSHPEFPPKQRVAVAFAEARRANGPAKSRRLGLDRLKRHNDGNPG